MKQAFVKDSDIQIVGTLERLTGRGEISGFGDTFADVEWQGSTEVFWDEQKTVQRDGKDIYLDEDGNEYTEDQLELRDDESCMNIQRLKFAYARGARIEVQFSTHPWSPLIGDTIHNAVRFNPLRIHPDDAHLEYGPISSAMQDIVLYPSQTEWSPYKEMALVYIDEYAGQGYSDETWAMCGLFLAEYLADEGL